MKRLISILVALSAWGIAIGQPSVRIAHGPYLQQVTDDGFTVVWTTTINAASWVEVAPDDGSHFYAAERPKYYDSHIGKRRIGRLHRVRVEGLAPGTTYRYRIMQQGVLCDEGNKRVVLGEGYGSDILKHKPYTATTLDEKKDQTEFWVVNDIHAQDSIFRLLLEGAEKAKPDFVCFNGDMLTSMESEKQLFEGYLNSAAELLTPAGIPIFATRGNHENRGSFSPSFLDYFPTSTGEVYYTFRQGPAYFVVLDCGEDKPDSDIRYYGLSTTDAYREQEARWLKGVVESEEYRAAPLHIVVLHMIPGGKSAFALGTNRREPIKHTMKTSRLLTAFATAALLLGCAPGGQKAEGPYYIDIKDRAQLHEWFRYSPERPVVISGHRGGMVTGFPENCIESFEKTLTMMPSFFEIDPRMTKDSVIVLMHDATIDRTTTGTGKVSDYTYAELQQFFLKDREGNVTTYKIPTLEECIAWSQGKTILNLDIKDVPLEVMSQFINRLAPANVMYTVRNAKQARTYLDRDPQAMFSCWCKNMKEFNEYVGERIPWSQVMAYVGTMMLPDQQELYDNLHRNGVMCMISLAPTHDRRATDAQKIQGYELEIPTGCDVIETDYPYLFQNLDLNRK